MAHKRIVFLAIFVTVIRAGATVPDCDAMINETSMDVANGNWQLAESRLSEGIVHLESIMPGSECLGVALNNLASIMQLHGRWDEAERYAMLSMRIFEQNDSADPGDLRHPLLILARIALAQAQFTKARHLIERLQSLPTLGAEDAALMSGIVAQLLIAQHRDRDAVRALNEALVQWEKAGEASSLRIVPDLNNLALLYVNGRRFSEAKPLLERALRLEEGGTNPVELIGVLNTLGVMYATQHHWPNAEACYQRAIELSKNGILYPSIMKPVYQHYLDVLRRDGRKQEAKALEADIHAVFGHETPSLRVDVEELMPKHQ